MKKFLSVILMFVLFGVCFAQNVSLNTEDLDPELVSLVEELNSEDYKTEAQSVNDLISEIGKINPESQVIDFSVYTSKLTPTDTEDFYNLTLSEKMKVYRNNSLIQNEMVQAFMSVEPSKKNSQAYIKQAELVKELMEHTTRLVSITTKIVEGSNDYVGVAIENLTEARELLEDADAKVSLLSTQVSFLNESLAYQEAKNKKAFIAGNVLIPTIGVFGLIPSIYLMTQGNEKGFDYMMLDLGVTLGGELIWNGGHLIFKWW